MQNCKATKETEEISTLEVNSRILAEDIYAPMNNPPFDRSPLDGFALRSEDVIDASKSNQIRLSVVDTVYAGEYCETPVQKGQAIRIMTGAPIPKGADCVIRIEDVEEVNNSNVPAVLIGTKLKHHENYCFLGEDVKEGELILQAGQKLTYIEQGILASMGIAKVKVFKKVKAGLYVTGDELMPLGSELKPGKIYDSNLQLLHARLCELGIEPVIAKYLPDDASVSASKLKEGISNVDFILTTGGVSVGDKDILHEVLPLLGAKRLFWKVKLKPGTPAMFAMYENKPMFHLSGNPSAAAITFELLVRPFLSELSHDKTVATRRRKAVLKNSFIKESKGRRFVRARVEDGEVTIPPAGKHASGILSSMQGCNCLIDIPAGSGALQEDCQIDIILL